MQCHNSTSNSFNTNIFIHVINPFSFLIHVASTEQVKPNPAVNETTIRGTDTRIFYKVYILYYYNYTVCTVMFCNIICIIVITQRCSELF